jgi:hypothetical protein
MTMIIFLGNRIIARKYQIRMRYIVVVVAPSDKKKL